MPRRIQQRRIKGWRTPANAVIVSRPSKFGNPFRIGTHGTAEECVAKFEKCLEAAANHVWHKLPDEIRSSTQATWFFAIVSDLPKLRGYDLACYCGPGAPCHADVLLFFANGHDRLFIPNYEAYTPRLKRILRSAEELAEDRGDRLVTVAHLEEAGLSL